MERHNEVIAWNAERGLLDTFDPCLELKMLSEEAREFYTATTYEHRLAEYADFKFVKAGTLAKYHSQKIDSATVFSMNRPHFVAMMEWAEEIEVNMFAVLSAQSRKVSYRAISLREDIAMAIGVVIDNNKRKGTSKINGKIVKPEDPIDPVVRIRELLDED